MTRICIDCQKTKTNKKWYGGDTCKACYMKQWRKANPAAVSAIEARRKDYSTRTTTWRQKNPERWRALSRRAYLKNPGMYKAHSKARKAICKQAMPSWLSVEQCQEMASIYNLRPEGHDVDHIVPLRGKDVCGLHVPWNLQYLPSAENGRKSNKLWP